VTASSRALDPAPTPSHRASSGSWRDRQIQAGTLIQSRSATGYPDPARAMTRERAAPTPASARPATVKAAALAAGEAFASGVMPDLGDPVAVRGLLHLDHAVDQQVEEGADVLAGQVAASLGFPHQKGQLFEG